MSVIINSENCTGCGSCASVCPVQAISIIQNKALIDQNECDECLQCISECPNNAIFQTSDREISVTKREISAPYSVRRVSPQPHQVFGAPIRKQRTPDGSGKLLNRIIEAANSFFRDDSSLGRRKRIRKRGHQGYRRRHRGGRFKH